MIRERRNRVSEGWQIYNLNRIAIFGILFIITMHGYKIERVITTYLPIPSLAAALPATWQYSSSKTKHPAE